MEKRENKKRYYKVGQVIWSNLLKKEVVVESIDKVAKEITYKERLENGATKSHTSPLWTVDKLKYKAKEKLKKEIAKATRKKVYFASVKGGIIPTKDEENAGRDCYARLEPKIIDGKEVFEMLIPRLTLGKIPLGFASYLDKKDLLTIKHERSSVGSTGLINVSGLIDSTYQGEVILQVVPLVADIVISSDVEEKYFDEKTNTYFIPYHKAIAQAVLLEQSQAEEEIVTHEELLKKPSTRGTGGWGSTGK